MELKMKRKKPMNLLFLEMLKCRKALPPEHNRYLADLTWGFEHECKIDKLIEEINGPWITIPGFSYYQLFEKNFQLDLLLVTAKVIYISEIKGYRSDLYIDAGGVIKNKNGTIIDDPLDQVKKATEKFQNLLDRLKIDLKIQYNVIIATEGGTVYGLTDEKPILLQHQVQDYYRRLARKAAPPTTETVNLVNTFLQFNNDRSHRWPNMPEYSYQNMEKGLYYSCCGNEVGAVSPRTFLVTCQKCQKSHKVLDLVINAYNDFILFFNEKPSTPKLQHWIDGRIERHRLLRWKNKGYFD